MTKRLASELAALTAMVKRGTLGRLSRVSLHLIIFLGRGARNSPALELYGASKWPTSTQLPVKVFCDLRGRVATHRSLCKRGTAGLLENRPLGP